MADKPFRIDDASDPPTPVILRGYQGDMIAALRLAYAAGCRCLLMQLATAAGKTPIAAAIAALAVLKGGRVLLVVHRRELLRQAVKKLRAAGAEPGILAAGFPATPDAMVQVASIATLMKMLDQLPAFKLIVLDEAHHCRAEMWTRLLAAQPHAKVLGLTATPLRLDGKGLGVEYGGAFDDLVCGPPIAELIRQGFLARPHCYAPARKLDLRSARIRHGDYVAADIEELLDTPSITGDLIAEYRGKADHLSTIAFCVSIAHAQHVAEAFRAAGYRSAAVFGAMKTSERDRLIAGLGTGEIEVLTSCDLISEGLDVPDLGAVILLRPTKSLTMHLQQIGRGMRPAPNKSSLIVLDHVGNIVEHGLPDADRTWALDGKMGRETATAPEQPPWRCEACGTMNRPDAAQCSNCGEPRRQGGRPREIAQVDGELIEVTAERLRTAAAWTYREMARGRRTEAELRAFAEARGYKPGWVRHTLREQTERFDPRRKAARSEALRMLRFGASKAEVINALLEKNKRRRDPLPSHVLDEVAEWAASVVQEGFA